MIDYRKRPTVHPSVKRALEVYELWDKRVTEAKANNADPTRKHVTIPHFQRADAAKALALATREWINR